MRKPVGKGDAAPPGGLARVWRSAPVRAAALALLATVAYGEILRASVAWDDAVILSANPAVRSLRHPWLFFTDPRTIEPSGGAMLAQYRPLRTLAYALEFAVFGGAAWGYHLVSLLLHGACAFAVGTLARRLFGGGAWLAAAAWVVLPVLSENALYLAAQSNELCLLGACLALVWHLEWLAGGRAWRRAAAVAAALAAMLAYEFGAVVPLLVILVELLRRARGGSLRRNPVARHLPYWLALGAFLGLRAAVAAPMPHAGWWGGSWTASAVMQLRLWLEAWRLSVLPVAPLARLMPYDIPGYATAPVAVLFHVVVLAAAGLAIARRKPGFAVVVAWWYAAQAPTSNLLVPNLGYPFATRFLFLATVLPVAAAAAWLEPRLARSRALQAVAAIALVAAVAADRRQAGIWRNELTLFDDVARRSPGDFTAHYNLGQGYVRFGMPAKAVEELTRAAEIDPGFAPTFVTLGDVARSQGNAAGARSLYRMALQRYPKNIGARTALARLDLADGEAARAESWVAPIGSLERWPPYARARFEVGLAEVAAGLRKCGEARRRAGEAVGLWSHTSDVLLAAGKTILRCGDRGAGLALLGRASEAARSEYLDMVGDTAWRTD